MTRLKPRRFAEYIRFVIILAIVLYITVLFLESYNNVIVEDEGYAHAVPGMDTATVIAKECSGITNVCYNVVDYAVE